MGKKGFSRRGFLAGGATVAAGGALAACAAPRPDTDTNTAGQPEADPAIGDDQHQFLVEQTVDFDGTHQAGIDTPHQAHLNLVGFRLVDGLDATDVARLMRLWTEDARRLCHGQTPVGSLEPEMTDKPANLTITCGIGPGVFEVIGAVDKRPTWLTELPAFSLDQLDDAWGQADLVLQICSDDPITASHAMRHMVRVAPTYAATQWVQQGFLNAHGASGDSPTPRNLFGQLDGSANPQSESDIAQHVWTDEGPDWAVGGSAMVLRRIRMNLDTWEMLDRGSRENSIGRNLDDGAPLTGGGEFDDVDLTATDQYGLPTIDRASHVARARPPAENPEQVILRRSYNYDLPPQLNPADGQLSNAGQVFICFQKDPELQFTPIQRRLDEQDLLNEWITHIGSGVYWIPPGTRPGEEGADDYWAQRLLEHHLPA